MSNIPRTDCVIFGPYFILNSHPLEITVKVNLNMGHKYIHLSHTQLLFRSEMRRKSNYEARQAPAAIRRMNMTIPLQTTLMFPRHI